MIGAAQRRVARQQVLRDRSSRLRSAASSCSILIASSRASCRRRISRMSSAWRSRQLERLDQCRLGLVRVADDLDDLSMLSSTIMRPSRIWMRSIDLAPAGDWVRRRDGREAELDPFADDVGAGFLPRPAVAADHHQVDRDVDFQAGMRQQQVARIRSASIFESSARTPGAPARRGPIRRAPCRATDSISCFDCELLGDSAFLPALDLGIGEFLDLFQHLLRRDARRQFV